MKYFLATLILFFSILLFAQHEDEDFLNNIRKLERNYQCDSILLLCEKSILYLNEEVINELNTELPLFVVDELIQKNNVLKRTESTWKISEIKNAKGVTLKDSLGIVMYKDFYISDSLFNVAYHLDTISNWETIEFNIDSLNKKGIYASDFSSFPHCYRYTSIFSYPLITENGKWAIIEQVKYVRSLNASGAIIIYKRKGKKWKLIGTVGRWVS